MYHKSTLLSKNNHKTIKGEKFGYITYIMYLSPFTQNSQGINLCPHASKGCSAACLFKSGMGGIYANVMNGRINKTEWYLENRPEFMATLDKEIAAAIKRHAKETDKIVTFRLNGTSDIRWEKIKVRDGKNLFELYPDVQFYDYTKNPLRMELGIPNYQLTFSRSEENHIKAMKLLGKGHNVAMVFYGGLPKHYKGYEVINGDESDLRFKDGKGVVVGLKYKNVTGANGNEINTTAKQGGFVILTDTLE